MGPGGPVGINHNSIYRAMDLYGVENRKDCFEKVLILSAHILKAETEKWKSKHGQQEKYSHRLRSFKG